MQPEMHKSLECLEPGRPGHPLHSPLELRERPILFKFLGMVWETLLYLTYSKATHKGYKATSIIWTFLGDIFKLSPNSTPKLQTYALIPSKRRNNEASRCCQREAGSISSFLGPEDGLSGHHKQVVRLSGAIQRGYRKYVPKSHEQTLNTRAENNSETASKDTKENCFMIPSRKSFLVPQTTNKEVIRRK